MWCDVTCLCFFFFFFRLLMLPPRVVQIMQQEEKKKKRKERGKRKKERKERKKEQKWKKIGIKYILVLSHLLNGPYGHRRFSTLDSTQALWKTGQKTKGWKLVGIRRRCLGWGRFSLFARFSVSCLICWVHLALTWNWTCVSVGQGGKNVLVSIVEYP